MDSVADGLASASSSDPVTGTIVQELFEQYEGKVAMLVTLGAHARQADIAKVRKALRSKRGLWTSHGLWERACQEPLFLVGPHA